MRWVAYRARRGSLNIGLRVDFGSAQLAAMYANANTKNGGYKPADFMPYQDHSEAEISMEEAMAKWE